MLVFGSQNGIAWSIAHWRSFLVYGTVMSVINPSPFGAEIEKHPPRLPFHSSIFCLRLEIWVDISGLEGSLSLHLSFQVIWLFWELECLAASSSDQSRKASLGSRDKTPDQRVTLGLSAEMWTAAGTSFSLLVCTPPRVLQRVWGNSLKFRIAFM